MYNKGELNAKVAIILQRSGDAAYATKIDDWLNFAQEYAYKAYDYYQELEDIFTFNTVNGTEAYYLPSSFDKPLRIYNMTSPNKLTIWTEESYEDSSLSSIANSNTGTPSKARLFGVSPINALISASGITCKAKSSSLSDTAGFIVRVEGYVDAAMTVLDYENIVISTGTPTTFATAASPKTFYKITRVTKSADTVGFITLANSAGTTLAILGATDRQSRYPVLKLGLIPDAAYSMRILFKRRINKMVSDNDYPFIDADEFYVDYATGFGLSEGKETLDRAAQLWSRADKVLMDVIRNQQTRLGEDFQHKMVSKSAMAHRV